MPSVDTDATHQLEEIAAATARGRRLIAARHDGVIRMAGAPDKIAALMDAARALDNAGIPYALVGGVAVGIHSGVPCATADTNLAVPSTVDGAAVSAALTQASFRHTGAFAHSLIFRHTSGEPVQIVCDAPFDAMIEHAERFDVSGVSIRIVGKADLIAVKERAAADPTRRRSKALRDQADMELLRGDVPDPDEGW